jgi:hypothetical protein
LFVQLFVLDWRKHCSRFFHFLKIRVEVVHFFFEVLGLEVNPCLELLLLNELLKTILVHISHKLSEHFRLIHGHVLEELR